MTTKSIATSMPTPIDKPVSIVLTGYAHTIFQESVIHIRNGYSYLPGVCPEILQGTGQAVIQLVLGSPQIEAEVAAEATIKLALEMKAAEYKRDVEAGAKRLVEAEKAAAIRKQLTAQAADHAKAIAALEKQLAATEAAKAAIL